MGGGTCIEKETLVQGTVYARTGFPRCCYYESVQIISSFMGFSVYDIVGWCNLANEMNIFVSGYAAIYGQTFSNSNV